MHRTLFLGWTASALLFGLAVPVLAQVDPAATIVWTGASNNLWDVPANWNPARVPDESDHVEIATGTTVQLNVAASIASLRLGQSSGTSTQTLVIAGQTLTLATNSTVNAKGVISFNSGVVGGAGLLSVHGRMDWTDGTMTDRVSVRPGGTLNLLGNNHKVLSSEASASAAVLTNLGLVTWNSPNGFGSLSVRLGSQIINDGTWRLDTDGVPFHFNGSGEQPDFLNRGTFVKAAGTTSTDMGAAVTFTNLGAVTAQSSPIRFTSLAHFGNGGQLNGPFPIRLIGTITFDRPVLNTLVELVGGTLGGDVTFTGTSLVLNWSDGTILDSLTIPVGGTLNLLGDNHKTLSSETSASAAVLTNLGLVTWNSPNGFGSLSVRLGSQILNDGTWRLDTDGVPFHFNGSGEQPDFLNRGTFVKAAGTTSTDMGAAVTFTNLGAVTAQSSPIRFTSLAHFGNGSQLNGPFPIHLVGTITFDRPVLNTLVELLGGTLGGDVTLTGTSQMLNWSDGTILDSLTIPVGGTLNLLGNNFKTLSSETSASAAVLTNLGLVTWNSPNGFGSLSVRLGTQIINDGTWRLDSDGTPFYFNGSGEQPDFLNRGTFVKASGTTSTDMGYSVTFTNLGAVTAQSSPIRFTSQAHFGNGGQLNGPFPIRLLGTITFDRPVLNTLVELLGGTLGGDVTLTGTSLVLNWSDGTILDSLTIPAGGTLNLLGNNFKTLSSETTASAAVLTNLGLVTWNSPNGSGSLSVRFGTQIINDGTWRLDSDGTPFYFNGGGEQPIFLNRGNFIKPASGSVTAVSGVQFDNDGTLTIPMGRLHLPGGQNFGPNSRLDLNLGGAGALTDYGQLQFGGAGTVRGDIAVTLTGGFVPAVSNRFTLVQAAPLSGSFASQNLPSLPPGLSWQFEQDANSVSLVVESATNLAACEIPPSGLALWLPAEGSPINRAGSNYAVLNDNATYGFGRVGRAFMLDGVGDYVSVADSPALRGTNLTVEGWFKFFSLGGARILVSKTVGGGVLDSYALWIQDANLHFAVSDEAGFGVMTTALNPVINTWYHLAATFDDQANVMRLFINGVPAASQTEDRSMAYDDHPVLIGAEYENESLGFFAHGLFDEVAIYSRALASNEVASIFAAGSSGKCTNGLPSPPSCLTPPSSLVGWWPGDGHTNNLVASGDPAILLNGAATGSGLVNEGFSLDGDDDLISIGDLPTLQNATELTVMAWVAKPYGADNAAGILGQWDTTGNVAENSFLLYSGESEFANRGALALQFDNGAVGFVLGVSPLPAGDWIHIAATWSSSNGLMRLYKNGLLDATSTNGLGQVLHRHTIFTAKIGEWGKNNNGAITHWRGLIDEPMISNRALSADEIGAIIAAGTAGLCRPAGGVDTNPPLPVLSLRADYRFENNLASSVAGAPPLTDFGAGNYFVSTNVGGTPRTVFHFAYNTGLGLSPAGSVGLAGPYTVVALFAFDQLGSYRRILDFKNRATDDGLYALHGDLRFYPVATGAGAPFSPGIFAQIVLTRDATNLVTGYVNGIKQFEFDDAAGRAAFETNSLLSFFRDNDVEASAGSVARIRVFDRALNASEVAALDRLPGDVTSNFADLVITNVSGPAAALMGQSVPLVYTIRNNGSTSAFGPWLNEFRIATSADGGGAQSIGTVSFAGELAPGGSQVVTQSVILPAGVFGVRYLGVLADGSGYVIESNETNNSAFASVAITINAADLVSGNLNAPASAQFGQDITVTYAVTNIGDATASGAGVDQIYLSTTSNSLAGATFVETVSASPLNAGASYSRTQAVTLPLLTDLSAGTYFIVIVADAGDAQSESQEDNNLVSRAITLSYPPLPDLAVTRVLAPIFISGGNTARIVWTTTNQGPLTATGSWSDVVAISNSVFGVQALQEFLFTNALPPGASITSTQDVAIPLNLPVGDWRFLVTTDDRGDLFEQNEINNAGYATNTSEVPAELALTFPVEELTEGAPAVLATVTRNGDRSAPLTITITNGDASELRLTNSVVIPAGQDSTTFAVAPLPDGIVDGSPFVLFSVNAPDYRGASIGVTVRDVDVPRLFLSVGATSVVEGLTFPVTVRRDYATNLDVTVVLSATDPRELSVPASVVIRSNQLSASFTILAEDDTVVEALQTQTFLAMAAGFESATDSIMIVDNDTPLLSLRIAADSVSEGDGPQATTVTITRTPTSARAMTLGLESSNPALAQVPATVVIPGNETAVSFPIAVTDNGTVDGTRTVTIRAFLRDSAGNLLAELSPGTLQVLDDDGPTLKVALARHLTAEGLNPASSATVTRNSATNAALTVTLNGSDTTELTVPAGVTIPAGQSSASFDVVTPLDNITDGSQTAIVTASAPGFTSGSDIIVVTDIDLPDLTVVSVSTPTNGLTDGNFTITYRVENRGIAPSTSNFRTRVLLSTDTFAGNDDALLSESLFEGSLPVGLFIERTEQFHLPNAPGRYWIIVVADAGNAVAEVLENNNEFISALPIDVVAAYVATVETPVTTALTGATVPMSGSAVRAGTGLPAVNVPINVHLLLRGTRRLLPAVTDVNGNFTATFTPLPGEAGVYEIGAAHPGAAVATVQDTFTLFGLKVVVTENTITVTEGGSSTGALAVVNLGETPLTGLTASVVSSPANLNVSLTLTNPSLAALGSNQLGFVITASDATTPFGEVRVRVTSSSGASSDAVLPIAVESLQPRLVASPESLYAAMVRGGQASVDFTVANLGGVTSEPILISLPNVPWLRVGSANPLPALAPGQSNQVTLLLTPDQDLPLGPYTGSISLDAGAVGLDLPFTFRAMADLKGDLLVVAVDEFTYYAAGAPKVTNAPVIVRDAFTRQTITNGVTDAQGQVRFPQLTEGHYEVEVTAADHSPFVGTMFLSGGRTNLFETFLSRQMVEYRWTVVPTEIADRTRIVIETLFETFVPAPVITIEPALIDLAGFTGTRTQINLTIKNHGLVAAQDFVLNFPDHPDFSFTPLVTDIGALRAQATLVVPLSIERKSDTGLRVHAAGSGPCSASGGACWQLPCGPRKNKYCASVSVMNINCPQPASIPGAPGGGGGYALPPVPNGLGGGFATGFGAGGGSAPFVPPRRFEPPQICDCDEASFDPTCLEVNLEATPVGGPIAALKSALQGKIPYLEEFDVSVSGKAKLCTCCEEGSVGFKASGSGSLDFKGKINVPLGPAFPPLSLPSFSIAGYEVHVEAKVGCFFTPAFTAQATVSGKTDCFLENIEACGEMTVSFSAVANCGISGEVLLVKDGVTNKTALEADAGSISTGLKGSVKYCYNGESENTLCSEGVKIKLGSIKITLPDGTEHSKQLAEIVLIEGTCPEEGGRPGPFMAKPDWVLAGDAAVQRGKEAAQALAESILNAKAVAKGQKPEPEVSAAGGEEGVCARVRLQIDQEVVMARNAFNATLELINSSPTPIEDVSITLVVVDEFGNGVDERFGVRPPTLSGLTGVDGNGSVAPNGSGSASWILVPTSEAAPLGPTRYGVGGVLSYRQDGRQISIPLFPAPITVHPDPRLTIKYFHQRDVFADDPFTRDVIEPSIPFNLAVLVQNKGRGTARNVRIVSGQPQIIENEKGLLIDFKIIGTEVSGEAQSPSLTATFGEIAPDANAYGRWLLTSTLQGLFLDYKATFEHLDSLGKTNLSLIEAVTIHEMTHLVQAPGALEDGRPDFLVNDVQDPDALPDMLYLSTGATNPVTVVQQADAAAPNAGDLDVQLTAAMPQGWGYLRVLDPADGQFQLQRVVRSDGVEIYFGTNVWTTDRTFLGQGRRPVRENILHLLDYNSTGSYTLYYALPPADDTIAPSSMVLALPPNNYAEFPIHWSGDDGVDGSGVAFFDIYVSADGEPFTPWLQGSLFNSSVYQGEAGHTYGFYSIAVDVKGNRESAPVAPDTQTTTTLINIAPVLTLPAQVTLNEGDTLSLTATATDADVGQTLTFALLSSAPAGVVLNSINGQLTWATAEGNGPGTNQISVKVTDNGQPAMSANFVVTVIVNEVNNAPVLAEISNRTINELQNLSLALAASDTDLPPQKLTFSLGAGAPLGVTLNSSNGVFSWTPTTTQGPTTNHLTVIVRDNGAPQLSATQSFTVIIRDTGADFTVSLGSTNLFAGQSGHVPLNLQSGFDLTNISFGLDLSASGLTNLTLSPVAAAVGSATLSPSGLNRYQVRLVAGAGEVLQGAGEFARLSFATSMNLPSALVYLVPTNVTGMRSTGELLPKGGGGSGRVIVVNREPVLIASAPPRRLEVFGRPGVTYDLLSSTNVLGPWLPAGNVTLAEAISSIITLPVSTQDTFYRAKENLSAGAPLLEFTPVGNRIDFTIRGESGRTYTFQSAPAVTGPWTNELSLTFTNAFHSFSRTNGSEPARFFRGRLD